MCVSRASSLDTRSEQSVRWPRSVRRPWVAATARSDGIAARSPPAPASLRQTTVAPASTSAAAASATRSTAAERPSSASNVASTTSCSSAASPSGVTRNDGSTTSGGRRTLHAERRARADERRDRHHGALAVVVDRRVRDLREALPKVRRERPSASRERRDRRVVAHRVDGLLPRLRDRPQHQAQLLSRVAVERVPARGHPRAPARARPALRTAGSRRPSRRTACATRGRG